MVELERRGLLPSFALSFFKPLSEVADPLKTPARLAWIGDDVLLLAPYQPDEAHWAGFLIAEAEAGGQIRQLRSEDGETLEVMVPAAVASAGAVMAEEGLSLPIV